MTAAAAGGCCTVPSFVMPCTSSRHMHIQYIISWPPSIEKLTTVSAWEAVLLQIASKIVLQPMTLHCRITECFHYQTELGWVSMSAHKHCRKVNCPCPVCLQHIVTVPQNHGQSREEGFAPNFAVQDAQRHCVFLSSLCISLTRVDEATAHIVQYCSQCVTSPTISSTPGHI